MAVPNEINHMAARIQYTIDLLSSNMLASFGIIVPTTLFKVMAVRLNAPELNIETVWKRKISYQYR